MSDIEANKKAFADERQVISGSQLSKEAWSKVKEAREEYSDFALPSGQISKYAKPEFTGGWEEVTVDDIDAIISLCLRHRLRKDPLESIDSGDKVKTVFEEIFK